MTRSQKRIKIILIYLVAFLVLGGVIYFMTRPEMTCSDGIKNQGEEGVDCGGVCAPCQKKIEYEKLQVKSVEIANNGKDGNDVVIKIYNPNEEYGAKSFRFVIQDDLGNRSKVYKDFILPKETKYVIVNDYILTDGAKSIEVGIDNGGVDWRRAVNYREPKLIVFNERFEKNKSGGNYGEIIGLLVNKSAVDYETIKVKGILRDDKNSLIGASHQIVNTLPAGAKREFHIIFPVNLGREVSKVEVQTETNIFESDNYLRVEGRGNNLDR